MILGARAGRLAAACALVLGSSGCITLHRPPFMEASSVRDWPAAIETARKKVAEGRYESADTVLANFLIQYPRSNEARETAYWRALFKLDPSNHAASFAEAIRLLDGYLADNGPRKHVDEAAMLRRVAGQMDGLNKLAANALVQPKDSSTIIASAKVPGAEPKPVAADATATNPALEAENKRLKDELAKVTAELERIRRRLAQPPPPTK
jgi:hypothetical protein